MRAIVLGLIVLALFGSFSMSQERQTTQKNSLEPAKFWTSLANNEGLDKWARGMAVYQLFERHVAKNMTLAELARVLNGAKWFKEEDVTEVRAVYGWTPLIPGAGDTMFSFRVFPNEVVEKNNKECIALHTVFSGKLDKDSLLAVLANRKNETNSNCKLKAWAFTPTWPEFVKRSPKDYR